MTCPICHQHNPVGAIFCLACGESVLRQPQAHAPGLSRTRLLTRSVQGECAVASTPHKRCLRATVLHTGRSLSVVLAAPVAVGRSDQARGIQPDLDLSESGGYDGGVSRQHACISMIDGMVYVEDLHSANGSYINDQRLTPHTRYQLRPNDRLQFGSIVLQIDQIS